MTQQPQHSTARTVAQAILNVLCLAGLYAAAWTARLDWSWFLAAVGLSMAWITPALLIQGFQMYARAMHAPPPGAGPLAPPGAGGSSPRPGGDRPAGEVSEPPTPPPGVFGFVEIARGAGMRPILAMTLAALLGAEGCSGGGGNIGNVLDAAWKVVTTGCNGVRMASPLVDGLLRPGRDAEVAPPLDAGAAPQ